MKQKVALSAILFSLFSLSLTLPNLVQAQNNVEVKASVGKYYFSAKGIVSPYASVVMTTQNTFMSSTVADEQGNFSLPEALVNEGFTDYCLEAVDIKRIGSSYTCFTTEPASADFTEEGLFLAPTVGLSGRKITPDSSILASGYSMPGSDVSINLREDLIIKAKADTSGFYKVTIADVPAGEYEIYSMAIYQSKVSEKPTRTFKIESISRLASIPKEVLIIPVVLVAGAVFILLFILWKRRKKKQPQNKAKRSLFFFWRA